MKKTLIKTIDLYQTIFSYQGPYSYRKSPHCVFYPSCSDYAKEAVTRYGLKGILLSARRLLRCHPWQKNYFDPLP